MEQVLICLENKEGLKIDILTAKQKELVALGKSIISGYRHNIAEHVEKALDAGASRGEILKIVEFILRDRIDLKTILELLRELNYEENKRTPLISVVDDVRED